MAVELRSVSFGPLKDFSAAAPDGVCIGVIGEDGAGKGALLCVAAGVKPPGSGELRAAEPRRLIGPDDPLDFGNARTLLLDHAFARHDWMVRARAAAALELARRSGTTILLFTHEEELLRELCDELWWLRGGGLHQRGAPAEVLPAYRRYAAQRLRESGEGQSPALQPLFRRGDGRAQITGIEIAGASGRATMVLSSGERAEVRVTVTFQRDVADPVVGIMIRTRIGMEAFGTNTVLENAPLGPSKAGDTLRVKFAFDCNLCPQEYTLTVASHDPDGVWHEWLDDAVVFTVTDTRYTAGVANLRARVSVERV